MTGSRLSLAATACAAVLVPTIATAGNGTHPRTPVVWEDVPCMTLHDRSASSTMHVPYAIPYEDTEVGEDEVADSRRHQFFAFCRPHHPLDFLPGWITQADADAALAIPELVTGEVTEDDILELVPEWADCWHRINADDERRPITFEMADQGVDWDVSSVAAGAYTLQGFTHEPEFNVWWPRPGVVKIHDGDPQAVGPAAAVSTPELTPYRDEEVMIEGCVDTTQGSTYTVHWAVTPPPDIAIEWVLHLEDEEISGEDFAFPFTPPEPTWGDTVMFRIVVEDPQGRSYTTYKSDLVLVIDESDPEGCNDGTSFIGSPGCANESGDSGSSSGDVGTGSGSASGSDETADTSAATTTPGATADDGGGGGTCACTTQTRPRAIAALSLLLPLARRRRRA